MGTSGPSSGPNSNSVLVPTWVDEPGATEDQSSQDNRSSRPAIEPAPLPARFRGARRNFSAFAKSGGNNQGALRRAVRDYVRSGTGGSGGATRRMGSSRATARGMLGVFQGFQRDGIDATLQRHNLENLAGRPAGDIFIGLTDVICLDGGSIDEGIARDAWLETIVDIDQLGIENLDDLSTEQIEEVFLTFVTHAIETRLFQDIGLNGFRTAEDPSAIEAFEAQFHDYIRRAVRDAFSSDLINLSNLSDPDISNIVDETYRNAWDLLEAWGDINE